MSSADETSQTQSDPKLAESRDGYVDLILHIMRKQRVSLRTLARETGIGKSRLGLLLHNDPDRRTAINYVDLKVLFSVLDIDVFAAVICIEGFGSVRVLEFPRYNAVMALLGAVFRELPLALMAALEDLDHIDGSDVRPEWATGIQRAVVKRLVSEITRIASERAIGWDHDI